MQVRWGGTGGTGGTGRPQGAHHLRVRPVERLAPVVQHAHARGVREVLRGVRREDHRGAAEEALRRCGKAGWDEAGRDAANKRQVGNAGKRRLWETSVERAGGLLALPRTVSPSRRENTVRPVWASSADSGSSSSSSAGAPYAPRARFTRCFCPPLSVTPRSPAVGVSGGERGGAG